MTYAAKQDLIDRFGEVELIDLTDRADPPEGAIDDAVLSRALQDADSEINGYIAVQYPLPLPSTPDNVKRVACDMARYYLYADRVTEAVRVRYEDAVKFLKAIAAGTASLGLDPGNAVVATAGGVQYASAERVFTQDTLADYLP